ncbi:MAG TPA: contractile injection system protein, VgrG/Pvc8 family [Kofleriaceae bacterium]|nr:contractile injection system protein, VgrG/Pvc8 family [Kofleriaceae bacterium]
MANRAAAVDFDVLINGTDVEDKDVHGFVIDLDLDQPGMASVSLLNVGHMYNDKWKLGQSVEIKVAGGSRETEDGSGGSSKTTIFKGELVGMEPSYVQGGKSLFSIRAYDKLHRLLRGRKSKTYQKQTDQDIASAIAGDAGLSAKCGSAPKIKHEHVYQHNQTNLEFLRVRAKRLGYSIWVENGTDMYFDAPKLDKDSGLEFVLGVDGKGKKKMLTFHGRMSNSHVMKKVTVRGWDPEKKAEIVGEESAKSSPLGSKNAAGTLSDFGEVATFYVDHPIFSVEEAKAIAKSKLDESAMGFLTAEAEAIGEAAVKPGIVVKICVNEKVKDDRFNGKYLVQGCTHRMTAGQGFLTLMRLCRDAAEK